LTYESGISRRAFRRHIQLWHSRLREGTCTPVRSETMHGRSARVCPRAVAEAASDEKGATMKDGDGQGGSDAVSRVLANKLYSALFTANFPDAVFKWSSQEYPEPMSKTPSPPPTTMTSEAGQAGASTGTGTSPEMPHTGIPACPGCGFPGLTRNVQLCVCDMTAESVQSLCSVSLTDIDVACNSAAGAITALVDMPDLLFYWLPGSGFILERVVGAIDEYAWTAVQVGSMQSKAHRGFACFFVYPEYQRRFGSCSQRQRRGRPDLVPVPASASAMSNERARSSAVASASPPCLEPAHFVVPSFCRGQPGAPSTKHASEWPALFLHRHVRVPSQLPKGRSNSRVWSGHGKGVCAGKACVRARHAAQMFRRPSSSPHMGWQRW
jgi:hypothetical protein